MDGMGQSNNLKDYGIQTDESDFRIHISFFTGTAYIFPTVSGRKAIALELGEVFEASQKGTDKITGIRRKVPWEIIEDCREIDIPDGWREDVGYDKDTFYHKSTSEKGRAAEKVTYRLLKAGRVPIPLESQFVTDKDIQQQGKDFIIRATISIECKCDAWAGRTGVRLQTAESNPFKRY